MDVARDWKDYEILDMANGEKLEKWKDVILVRPDPQIIWKSKSFPERWKNANARYIRSSTGGGNWDFNKKVPANWQVKYKELIFNIKPMGFKHTGLFPEQAVNWDWMINKIQHANRDIKVLNLFAYTGGATVACSYAGASVCHVDSSKGMVTWAKENITSSGLQNNPVRYIIDDVVKFVSREIRRGNKYDAIIMDPPSYGRGTNGEVWKFEENISDLVELCTKVLSDRPLFFLINSYTTGISSTVLENILRLNIKAKGKLSSGELGLPMKDSNLVLPCGIFSRWDELILEKLKVIFEDNHIIVVEKPVNIPSQGDKTGDIDMISIIKDYLKEKYNKPGNVYLGLVHRLDRPVGGVMIFAKTSKAAARLSEQVREKIFKKTYLVIANGKFEKQKRNT